MTYKKLNIIKTICCTLFLMLFVDNSNVLANAAESNLGSSSEGNIQVSLEVIDATSPLPAEVVNSLQATGSASFPSVSPALTVSL